MVRWSDRWAAPRQSRFPCLKNADRRSNTSVQPPDQVPAPLGFLLAMFAMLRVLRHDLPNSSHRATDRQAVIIGFADN